MNKKTSIFLVCLVGFLAIFIVPPLIEFKAKTPRIEVITNETSGSLLVKISTNETGTLTIRILDLTSDASNRVWKFFKADNKDNDVTVKMNERQ